jgi:hypothetical protein
MTDVISHLRAACGHGEYFLAGKEPIRAWFQQAGVGRVSWEWVQKMNRFGEQNGFPFLFRRLAYGPMHGMPLCTNFVLQAWVMAVLPYLRGPRWSRWRRQLPRRLPR